MLKAEDVAILFVEEVEMPCVQCFGITPKCSLIEAMMHLVSCPNPVQLDENGKTLLINPHTRKRIAYGDATNHGVKWDKEKLTFWLQKNKLAE